MANPANVGVPTCLLPTFHAMQKKSRFPRMRALVETIRNSLWGRVFRHRAVFKHSDNASIVDDPEIIPMTIKKTESGETHLFCSIDGTMRFSKLPDWLARAYGSAIEKDHVSQSTTGSTVSHKYLHCKNGIAGIFLRKGERESVADVFIIKAGRKYRNTPIVTSVEIGGKEILVAVFVKRKNPGKCTISVIHEGGAFSFKPWSLGAYFANAAISHQNVSVESPDGENIAVTFSFGEDTEVCKFSLDGRILNNLYTLSQFMYNDSIGA